MPKALEWFGLIALAVAAVVVVVAGTTIGLNAMALAGIAGVAAVLGLAAVFRATR